MAVHKGERQEGNNMSRKDTRTTTKPVEGLKPDAGFVIGIGTTPPKANSTVPPHIADMYRGGRQG